MTLCGKCTNVLGSEQGTVQCLVYGVETLHLEYGTLEVWLLQHRGNFGSSLASERNGGKINKRNETIIGAMKHHFKVVNDNVSGVKDFSTIDTSDSCQNKQRKNEYPKLQDHYGHLKVKHARLLEKVSLLQQYSWMDNIEIVGDPTSKGEGRSYTCHAWLSCSDGLDVS